LPELAEGALLGFAVTERVLASVIHRVGGVTIEFGTLEAKAFGGLEHPSAALAGGGGVGDSHELGEK
jgi:hypothetical protein